jgi:hypothetical protein
LSNRACPDGVVFCTPAGTLHGPGAYNLSTLDGQQGGVPLVMFDANLATTVVVSPMNHFMASSVRYDNASDALLYGLQGKVSGLGMLTALLRLRILTFIDVSRLGSDEAAPPGSLSGIMRIIIIIVIIITLLLTSWRQVDDVPAGFVLDTLVFVSDDGVNAAMEGWGAALRAFHSTAHPVEEDFTAKYLSYYTDNGAYYCECLGGWGLGLDNRVLTFTKDYPTVPSKHKVTLFFGADYQTVPGKNYEETLVDVMEHAREQGIPYRSLQLDSWW